MVLLCECEWIFSHFLRFCAGAREYFEKNSLQNRIVDEKNFGGSRTGGAAALSRELSEFFGPKLFSCNAKPPGKNFPDRTDSQWESVKKFPKPRRPRKNFPNRDAYRTRKTISPCPIPLPPGKWAPGPYARHTFCNSGKFRFFGGWVPVPLRVLDLLWGGPMGPLCQAHFL